MSVAAALWWQKSVGLPKDKQQTDQRILAIRIDYRESYFCVARSETCCNDMKQYGLNIYEAFLNASYMFKNWKFYKIQHHS